ncbi:hypothetical protein Bca4012_072149 [Brassica carinata]
MISPCRRHQPESLSVESSPLSLWSTNPRLPRSPRRFRLSLSLSRSHGRIKRVGVSSKKRYVVWTDEELDNGSHSTCSLADDGTTRPPGVKAAKACGKKQVGKAIEDEASGQNHGKTRTSRC